LRKPVLTLLGGWARAQILGPIEIGVLRPSDIAAGSRSSFGELPSAFTDFKSAKLMAKYPPDAIPLCHRSLFREYLKKVAHNPLDRMMWVVLDNGREIMQLERNILLALASKLLKSTDSAQIKKAVEAMSVNSHN
jgi:hypothetical protein